MRIVAVINLDPTQWEKRPERLNQLLHNTQQAVGGVVDQTVWYRNDFDVDFDVEVTLEK